MRPATPSNARATRRAPGGLGLLVLVCAAFWGCGGHVLPEIHSEADRFATARRLYERGDYGDAVTLLKPYIDAAAGTAQVDEAIYLLGACYLGQKEWALAADQFERIARDYPESDSSGSAAFRLGEAYFGQSRQADFDQDFTRRALEQWENYLRDHPGHWLNVEAGRKVMEARTRLARKLLHTGDLYLKLRFLEPARLYYRQVIDGYGETSARPYAELGLALLDAREGKRAEAIEQLRAVETQYARLPIAQKAARERARLERK